MTSDNPLNMNNLLDLNKKYLHEKLDNVQKIDKLWVVADIVDILSNQKERDRRIINDFINGDEIVIQTIKRPSGIKTVRMFTHKGITRYLDEGKIYDLKNACDYFGVHYKDPRLKEYKTYLESIQIGDKKYKTIAILKWLFGKRKTCKALNEQCSILELLGVFGESEDADQHRLTYLKDNPI
jgi:hypothetical protein